MKKVGLITLLVLIVAIGSKMLLLQRPTANPKMLLFLSTSCPHCQKVKNFLTQNKTITRRVLIEQIIIDHSRQAQIEFWSKINECQIPKNQAGVPLLFQPKEKKCIIGDRPIIEYLSKIE